MRLTAFALTSVALVSCLGQETAFPAGLPSPPPPHFQSIARGQAEVWLLPDGGKSVYVQRGVAPPTMAFDLTQDGQPYPWDAPPTSLALFRGEFWIASGSRTLRRFAPNGVLRGAVNAPLPVTQVVATYEGIWVYDDLPAPVSQRLWWSRDGHSFAQVALHADETTTALAKLLSMQLVLTGGGANDIVMAHMIGPPEAIVFTPRGANRSIPLAYVRTAARDAMRVYRSGRNDLEQYSAPVRDLMELADGSVIVLRNREDARSTGGWTSLQGRRVDLYDPHGQQTGTAELPETGRFLLRTEEKDRVLVLTSSGHVITQAFGMPHGGEVLH